MKMETYTVQLNKENYFSVQSKLIEFGDETVRLVNLRSINGIIGEKFDLTDPKLQKIIMDYLRFSNNIELLNIYSRKYNKFNWFEIYNSDEIINQLANKLTENIQLADKFDESKVKNELKGLNNLLIPSKLYQNVHKSLPLFEKIDIDTCKFIPIWYINGSPKTKANCCELFTTFEILIHILSKRFISFKSILLDLSSVHIQKSQFYGKKLEAYLKMEKDSLADLLLQKDKTIDKLNKKIDDLIKTVKSQTQEIKSQTSIIENQTSRIDKQIDRISSLETKLIDGLDVIQKLHESHQEVDQLVQKSNNEQIHILKNYIPPEVIGRNQTKETIMFIYSPRLNDEIIQNLPHLKLESNEIILDTISCQLRDRSSHLEKHKFDKNKDQIIVEKHLCNSLDINKFIQNYSTVTKKLDSHGKYIRKFIVSLSNIDKFKIEFENYINEIESKHNQIISSLEGTSSKVSSVKNDVKDILMNYIQEDYYDKDEIENTFLTSRINYLTKIVENSNSQIEEMKNIQSINNERIVKIENSQSINDERIVKIENSQKQQIKQIEEIKNTQSTIIDLLKKINPKIDKLQIKNGHFYYDIEVEPSGEVKYATKRCKNGIFANYEPLTENLIKNSIFRDKDNPREIYLPSKRRNDI